MRINAPITPDRALRLIDEHETLENAFRTFLATDGRELPMTLAIDKGVRRTAERVGLDASRLSKLIHGHAVLTGDTLRKILEGTK